MILIDSFTLFLLLLIFVILFIVITLGCLGSYKKSIKLGKKGGGIWRNQRHIVLWNGAIFLTLFLAIIVTRIIISTIDISLLKSKMNDCDKLIIKNYYIDMDQGNCGQDELTVTEPETIKLYTDLFLNVSFIRVLSRSLYYNQDYIEIYIFKNNNEVGNIILTYNKLANFGLFGQKVYNCNPSDDECLIDRARNIHDTSIRDL